MAENPMNAAGELLQKKYAGMPFWVWLVLIGGTAFLTKRFLSGMREEVQPGNEEEVLDDQTLTPPSDRTRMIYGGVPNLPPGGVPDPNAPIGTPNIPSIETNLAWHGAAVQRVRDLNLYDNYKIDTTLRKYLTGTPIVDPLELRIINSALKVYHAPPEPLGTEPFTRGAPKVRRLVRFVRNPSSGLVVQEFSDGTILGIRNTKEYAALRASNPSIKTVTIASNDPWWKFTPDQRLGYAA